MGDDIVNLKWVRTNKNSKFDEKVYNLACGRRIFFFLLS